MTLQQFKDSLTDEAPAAISAPLRALWWDARGNWPKAHALVDASETTEAMAVHAYLHRREGDEANANYWYRRAGGNSRRNTLEAEWAALVERLLAETDK